MSPAAAIPSLVDERGRFRPGAWWLEDRASWRPDQLALELEAQVQRFTEFAGRAPAHLDSHQHILLLHPEALELLCALGRRHGLPVRHPGPLLTPGGLAAFVARVAGLHGVPLPLGDPASRAAALSAVWRPVRTATTTILDWTGPGADPDGLLSRLDAAATALGPAPVTVEVVVHPGDAGDRVQERNVLTAVGLRDRLMSRGWRLAGPQELSGGLGRAGGPAA